MKNIIPEFKEIVTNKKALDFQGLLGG